MIITDKFIIINYPKTGSSYVRKAIKKVYNNDYKNTINKIIIKYSNIKIEQNKKYYSLDCPKLYGNYESTYYDQHGVVRQIPKNEIGKPIMSIIRNPLTKYISSYVYGWWKKYPPLPFNDLHKISPNFPNISFIEFYELLNNPLVNEDKIENKDARNLGSYTRMFLVFFSKDPNIAAKKLIDGEALGNILPKITFLHQEKLKSELKEYLISMDISKRRIEKIEKIKEINKSNEDEKRRINKNDIKRVSNYILDDERYLLKAFPEYENQLKYLTKSGEISSMPKDIITGFRQLGVGTI